MKKDYLDNCDKAFDALRGRRWDEVSWSELSEIEAGYLSHSTLKYYIKSYLLVAENGKELINDNYNSTPLWNEWWLGLFLKACTTEQQEALWLYVKLAAWEGNEEARADIKRSWIRWRQENLGKRSRIYWNLADPWSSGADRAILI